MKKNYDNDYAEGNVYGHIIALLRRNLPAGAEEGVHLDLGCGYGRIAEPIQRKLGLHYVGLDLDAAGVASLVDRGFEAGTADLNYDSPTVLAQIRRVIAGRRLVSVTLIDVLEHLHTPGPMLDVVRSLVHEHGAVAAVSVPNLAHRDVGFKLAFGRYDMTVAGLLDHTHVANFTISTLNDLLGQHGLHVIDRNHVKLAQSDQHFPYTHPALAAGSVLGAFLRGLRDQADDEATTNQLVVACLSGPVKAPRYEELERARSQPKPFLSVVTRTQGNRSSTLSDVFLALAAQTCQDFEVILVGHLLDRERQIAVEEVLERLDPHLRARLKFIRIDHGNRTVPLNIGFAAANGEYAVILDDDDLPMAHWVETFRELARQGSGRLLRAVAVRQEFDWVHTKYGPPVARAISGFKHDYADHFDLFSHLIDNRTPGLAIAFPTCLHQELGIRFDEDLTTAEDWDFLMRCAIVCGVQSTPEVTCIYRWWVSAESSRKAHSTDEWRANHHRIHEKLDRLPMLLPRGSARDIRKLMEELGSLKAQLAQLSVRAGMPPLPGLLSPAQQDLVAVLSSNSWRFSAPLRRIVSALTGRPRPVYDVARMSDTEAGQAIVAIRESSSWRVTAPLRKLGSLGR